jgi:hypothetical protein
VCGISLATFRRNILPLSSGSKSKLSKWLLLQLVCPFYSVTLKMKTVRFSESSLKAYQIPRCHIPDDSNVDSQHLQNLKSDVGAFSSVN